MIGAMICCVKLIKRCVNFYLAKRTTAKICKGDLDEKNGSFFARRAPLQMFDWQRDYFVNFTFLLKYNFVEKIRKK